MSERWLPIPGCPNYEVSDHGRVRSLARVVLRRTRWGTIAEHQIRERVLKLGHRSGYPLASVHVGDAQITVYVHQAVMKAFGPPMPFPRAFVRHLDDVRSNNHISNLAWGTQVDNMKDAVRNGRQLGGYRPKGFREIDMIEWSEIYDI